MRRLYTDAFERCSVVAVKHDEDEWEIQNVWTAVNERGKGLMRDMMKRVLADADREGVVLILTSGVGRKSGMTGAQLVEWYERLGFDAIAPGSYPGTTIMQRVPRSGY